jgi:hypothetical protein
VVDFARVVKWHRWGVMNHAPTTAANRKAGWQQNGALGELSYYQDESRKEETRHG